MKGLQNHFICKRIIPVIPDNEMIQDCNIEHDTATFDLFRQLGSSFTGLNDYNSHSGSLFKAMR